MIRKLALAFVAVLAVSAFDPAPARADVDISINLGYGGWGTIGVKRGTCRHGLRIVDRRFNHVFVRDCRGQVYEYGGRRNGKWYVIKVSAYNGRIIDVRRWYR